MYEHHFLCCQAAAVAAALAERLAVAAVSAAAVCHCCSSRQAGRVRPLSAAALLARHAHQDSSLPSLVFHRSQCPCSHPTMQLQTGAGMQSDPPP